MYMNKGGQEGWFYAVIIFLVIALVVFGMVVYPLMKPWWASQDGKAELAQAEQNRQIAVLEATAKKESAIQLAQAEIERAKGVAESNRIISEGLKGNKEYLTYLWITEVATHDTEKTTVYIPTEANMPILEARNDAHS